jgi:TrmH family RNA methyltransferase
VRTRFVSSEQNPDIKRIKALRDRRSVRHAERLCIVEGPRFVADAANVDQPWLLVVSESRADDDLPSSGDLLIVPDRLFAQLSDTSAPQGILGVFPFPEPGLSSATPMILIADGIQDPGNLGTMIRSAAALGASQVICAAGTVDPFAPKVIRSAAAAHWHIPVLPAESLQDELRDVALIVTDGEARVSIDEVDLDEPIAIAIGSEALGVSESIRSLPHVAAAIPMAGAVESLNAGIAASIVLYEAQRQRRFGRP